MTRPAALELGWPFRGKEARHFIPNQSMAIDCPLRGTLTLGESVFWAKDNSSEGYNSEPSAGIISSSWTSVGCP